MTAFAAGLQAGSATASTQGTFDADDPDTMRGTFTISTRVTLISIPDANVDDTFDFLAQRVTDVVSKQRVDDR
jgi:hypothetical protein